MQKKILLCISLYITFNAHAQKPLIDTSSINRWTQLGMPSISNNGEYAKYTIFSNSGESMFVVVQTTNSKWKVEISNVLTSMFTQDSKKIIFTKPNDTLMILPLGSDHPESIPNVLTFKIPSKGSGKWLGYQIKNGSKEFVLYDLFTGEKKIYTDVTSFNFSPTGKILVLQIQKKQVSGETLRSLQLINLDNNSLITVLPDLAADQSTRDFTFDASDNRLAFIVDSAKGKSTSFWYYNLKTSIHFEIGNDRFLNDFSAKLDKLVSFSNYSNKIYLTLQTIDPSTEPKPERSKVDIWSYRDIALQSKQLYDLKGPNYNLKKNSYTAVLNAETHKIVRLEQNNDLITSNNISSPDYRDDYVLVKNQQGDFTNEWNWNDSVGTSIYLVSTNDGSRIKLGNCKGNKVNYTLSPMNKYIISYNYKQKDFFSYQVSSGKIKNITKGVGDWRSYLRSDQPDSSIELQGGIDGWLKNDSALIIYDRTDLFLIDPEAKSAPINITNSYGRKNNIPFHLISYPKVALLDGHEELILTAFNRNNKNSGFYSIKIGEKEDPEKLVMQPYLFNGNSESDYFEDFLSIIKAKDANVYMIRRESATESPNYFYTSDFKRFSPLSNNYPEKSVNWLTSELINWKMDGAVLQGILYKPENFNPNKKYPLIIFYYEQASNGLHIYLYPDLCRGPMNIPYFVSNGYLVFFPDIHYTVGLPGKSACNTIVSAFKYLSKMPYIDSKRVGLQGHSFGGFETNYIVTHTNLFAAAMSASGMSDFISCYGSIPSLTGISRQRQYELYRDRIGYTLWQRPDLYVENSPVLKADKATTPLLMMNNKNDYDVPFSQGVEFFTALRRLGKKVWMLSYDGGDHMTDIPEDKFDLTIRMKQFFDYYLKDAPAPKWMVEGIPAKMKGIDDGLELEPAGVKPGPGLLMKQK